jgi:mitochondrial fission protein ELM1
VKVWGLIDTRIGSSKQTVALAKRLDGKATLKNINYTPFIKIPNFLRPKTIGIDFDSSDELLVKDPEIAPDIIIFAGRRLAGLALYLKEEFLKNFKKNVKVVSILNPNYAFKNFFCVVLPFHDKIRANNVLTFRGALCDLDFDKMEREKAFWGERLSNLKGPYTSLMVGGDIKNKKFDAKKLGATVSNLSKKIREIGGALLLSTSRRTSQRCVEEIEKNLDCKNYFFKWTPNAKLNPYYGFLGLSDTVVITGESISMICEALTLKKNVLIYKPEESLGTKHIEFCRDLIADELAREIDCQMEKWSVSPSKGMNELEKIKNEILMRINGGDHDKYICL